MNNTFRIILATVMMAAISAFPATAAVPDKVTSGSYDIDPNHTQVEFEVLRMGFTYYKGLFSSAKGTLKLDVQNPSKSSLNVSVPVNSVLTTSTVLDAELKGSEWLNGTAYPDMTFISETITITGDKTADISGKLTINAITRPQVFHAELIGEGTNPMTKKYTIGFEIKGTLKRSDFGINSYIPVISDEVRLFISGAFEKREN